MYILTDTPTHVTVIRRHHPLKGKKLEVLKAGKKTIDLRPLNGSPLKMPREWTDADGIPPHQELADETVFTVESLRELLELINAFLSRP